METTIQPMPRAERFRAPLALTDHGEPCPTVLVVDDDALMGEMMTTYVRDCGYGAVYQAHGYAALRWLYDHPVALIITDLEMPIMDGWELCDQIDQLAQASDQAPPPIIVMTAQLRLARTPVLARAVLLKPFDVDELDQALQIYVATPKIIPWHPAPNISRKYRQASGE